MLEKPEGEVNNGQFGDTGNIGDKTRTKTENKTRNKQAKQTNRNQQNVDLI